MKIRQARVQARPESQKAKTQQTYSWPAPTMGWVANANLAVSQPGAAYHIENFFPTATGLLLRRGSQTFKEIDGAVRSMFSYTSGSFKRFFAATDSDIYDITLTETSVLSDQTGGKWVVAQAESSDDGAIYLRGVNGDDTPWVYDGSSFSDEPALTFPEDETVSPEDLSHVWTFKERFFFIEKETMNAWYLPVGQIGGELAKFSLGGLFKLGGYLVMGATWSRDTGSGMNAMCVFFSSEGEAAVYQGDNPASADSWQLVGVFRTGRPLGPNTTIDAGGDIVVATDVGFVPLSTALQTDFAILGNAALSENIVDAWRDEAFSRSGLEWNVAFWSRMQMVIVALPPLPGEVPVWWVVNARTRAWAPFKGWGATCLHIYDDRCFFGTEDGEIIEANVSGTDNGDAYTGVCVPMFDQMGVVGHKNVSMLRAVVRSPFPVRERLSVQSDYTLNIPPPPDAPAVDAGDVWGSAVWGSAQWGEPREGKNVYQIWRSAFGDGEVHAPCIQITSGDLTPLDAELVRIDATFTSGEVVV